MKIIISRDEAMACIIALEKERKSYGWQKVALKKLLKAMGLSEKKNE